MEQTLEQRQMRMYGCTEADIELAVADTIMGSPLMLAGSILSDAQEEMAHGQHERARQFINRAKYILFEEYSKQRRAERAAARGE